MKTFLKFDKFNQLNEAVNSLKLNLPAEIYKIAELYKKHGHSLYLVGGAVRDAVLGKVPKDFDFATDATPQQSHKFLESTYKVISTIKQEDLGVIVVVGHDDTYEIATFREDVGIGRRPDSVNWATIETDVKRRDLTINALFYDLNTKQIVDLVGGLDDMKTGIIKTVGHPNDRFNEDALRKLRAIRFAGKMNYHLDKDVENSLLNDNTLDGVSGERIREEFYKSIISSKDTKHYLELVKKFGFFEKIFPGLNVHIKDFLNTNDWLIQLTFILQDNTIASIDKILNHLKYSSEEIQCVKFLLSLKTLSEDNLIEMKKSLQIVKDNKHFHLKNEQILKFSKILGLDMNFIKAFLNFTLTVNGNDLIKSGIKPGPELGKKIKEMESINFLNFLRNR